MRDLLLGLDIGTTSAKGVLMTTDGHIMAQAGSTLYPIQRPKPGWAEQNPLDWWQAACDVLRQLSARADDGKRVAAVGVSGQGCAVTLMDAAGEVIRPAIIWMDTRSTHETEQLARKHAIMIERANGNAAGVYNVEPKLLWLRDHEPDAYQRAYYTLTTTAYITHQFVGEAVMNYADGGILFAYDAMQHDWNYPFLAQIGLRATLYPPLQPCTTIIGGVTEQAARACGLPPGTPVIAGGEDSPSAALSVGVCAPGDAFLSLGTAAVVGVCMDAAEDVREPRLLTYPHVLPGRSIMSGSMSSAGAAVEWFLREFGTAYGNSSVPYDDFNQALAHSSPGAGGVIFLPYLSGELHPLLDANARGVFFGLSTRTTRADMARAIIEGSAMAIRHNLEVAEQAGVPVHRLVASGGPTRSALWCQAIADITGQSVTITASGGAPVGDALLAGMGIGAISDIASFMHALVTVEAMYTPQRERQKRYEALYTIYRRLYPHLADDFAALAAWSGAHEETRHAH